MGITVGGVLAIALALASPALPGRPAPPPVKNPASSVTPAGAEASEKSRRIDSDGRPRVSEAEDGSAASKARAEPEPGGEVERAEISAIVRKRFPVGSKGGIAVLVVRDGRKLHSMGYGLVNGKTPVTPDTPMPLASVTKQFTAMCAAILIEEGRLKLTDRVSEHLPDVKLPVLGREPLVQDLLWHVGGLANFIKKKEKASIADYKKSRGLKRLTNKTHAEWLATMPPHRAPGLKFEYTNSGYVLLARIIEVIAGKPFHEFQQERIFDKLGMARASDSATFNGSGNMRLSLNDYEKWDRALWNGSLVKPETWKLIGRSGTLDDGEPVGYGFGWWVVHENGELVEMSHGGLGSAPGNARNLVLRDLRNRVTVVLLTRENVKVTRDLRKRVVEEIRDRACQLP